MISPEVRITQQPMVEQVNPASMVTQLPLGEDKCAALDGGFRVIITTINVASARLNLKQQVGGAITTTPGPCASLGTVILEGMQNHAVT